MKSDAQLTWVRSYIVRDQYGNSWGPFETSAAAANWGKAKWPDVPQWSEYLSEGYWDIEGLWVPN